MKDSQHASQKDHHKEGKASKNSGINTANKDEKLDDHTKQEAAKEEAHVHHKKKKEKKEKKARERNKGPVHITANGEPMPIVDDSEMDMNHPMWLEVRHATDALSRNYVVTI